VVHNCKASKDGFMDVMELFYPYVQHQLQIDQNELEKYKDCQESLARGVTVESRKNLNSTQIIFYCLILSNYKIELSY